MKTTMLTVLATLLVACGARTTGRGLPTGATTTDPARTAPSVAASISVVEGDKQIGEVGRALPKPIVLEVRDAAGAPIHRFPIAIAVTRGDGTIFPTLAVTDGNGRAQVTWTLGQKTGVHEAQATASTNVATFTATTVNGGSLTSTSGTVTYYDSFTTTSVTTYYYTVVDTFTYYVTF